MYLDRLEGFIRPSGCLYDFAMATAIIGYWPSHLLEMSKPGIDCTFADRIDAR